MRSIDREFRIVAFALAAVFWLGAGPPCRNAETNAESLKGTPWWNRVREDISQQEYEITWQEEARGEGAFHAANRAQNLCACFSDGGVELMPRAGDGSWCWGFELAGFGRDGAVAPVESPAMSAGGRRMEYMRGGLVEWYENREEGIEQGFVMAWAPSGDGPLVIAGLIHGDLEARLDADGQSVSFLREGTEVLRYGNLLVVDAQGRELASRLALEGNELQIMIEEEGEYPILVDPLFSTPSWTVESNRELAEFGCSVSSAGDVNGDGYSDVIVGAEQYEHNYPGEGRAFLYYGGEDGLSEEPDEDWIAVGNQEGANFGCSVACAGDVDGDDTTDVIIGAWGYDNPESDGGRAFVYYGGANGLSDEPDWVGECRQPGAEFGRSVSGAGDVNNDGYSDVIIGARWYDNDETNEGRAFVYYGGADGLLETPWTAESNQGGAEFGYSVASAGYVNDDVYADVIVGAWKYDSSEEEENEGCAYVFHGGIDGLSETHNWTAESDQEGAEFGCSVACAGDVNGDGFSDVIVGARSYSEGQDYEGRVFVFHGGEDGLSEAHNWSAQIDRTNARMGTSVSSAGDVNNDGYSDVIVGAPGYQAFSGGAFLYQGGPAGLDEDPAWTAYSIRGGEQFGFSVSSAGDVDNDGYSDAIVGGPEYTQGETREGRAYVYRGYPDPPSPYVSRAEVIYPTLFGDKGIVCPGGDGSSILVTVKNEEEEPIVDATVSALFFTERPTCRCATASAVSDTNGIAEISISIGLGDTSQACYILETVVTCMGVTIPWEGTSGANQDTREWVSLDLNCDCHVDSTDSTIFAADYLTGACRSDFDGDGDVDLNDLAIFGQHGGHLCEPLVAVGERPRPMATTSSLRQNYPNPFRPSTRIAFSIARPGRVSLRIYDVAGRRLRTLVDEIGEAREYSVTWDGRDDRGSTVPAGVYFYTLQTPERTSTKKMIFLR